MLPLVELRGAIPYSQAVGLPLIPSYGVAIVGNMLPIPVIYLFSRKVLEWGSHKKGIGPTFRAILSRGEAAGERLKGHHSNNIFLALLLFVMIPIPGTGAWSGTLAASILDLGFKKSVLATLLGILGAGVIMGLLSTGVLHLVR